MALVIDRLEMDQNDRTFELLRYMSIYSNRPLTDLAVTYTSEGVPIMPRQILNTTQAIVDTLVSKHVQTEGKAAFYVEDGDWEAQKKADALDCGVYGEFERINLYYLAETVFRDALICGDGWLKFTDRNGKVYGERTFPLEMVLDDHASYSTPPREMYQRRYLTREWAKSFWSDHAEELEHAQTMQPPYAWPNSTRAMLRIDEGWHLPTRPGAKDGRHIICCRDIVLLDDPWDYEVFPFVRISWEPAILGSYGQGLVEQLSPLQLELNKLLKRIHQSIALMSVPRIWQHAGTKVSPEYDNLVGNVYKYTGIKPEIDASPSVNPELFRQVDWIEDRMYKLARLSPIEAQGAMPQRMDSQPAMREHAELASTSHAWVGKMWERFFVDCAKQVMRVARELSADGGYKVAGRRNNALYEYDWKEIDIDDNDVQVKMAPASLLPTTPTGKRMVVEEMMDRGLITDQQQAMELLIDIPDIKKLLGSETSDRQLVEKQLWLITRHEEYAPPDEFQDPVRAQKMARQTYQELLLKKGVSKKVLAMLVQYMRECDALLAQSMPPQQPPAAPMPPPGVINNGIVPGSVPVPGPGPVPGGLPVGPIPGAVPVAG